ncbi:MAG: dTDP-4-dehydrorhamnose 3,5-epimerase [Candidatus Pelagibacterales bacterium]|nr:MAG: dTDP-4-dehydrorhamnose 3,5-epimerase [Pelagibacterales bacterium]
MKIISTKFSGLKIIQSKSYRDSRGFFKEDFKKKFFKDKKFVFGCTSSSKKNVLRGLHLQTKFPQGKYVSVLKGSIIDVVVDLRKNSKTFGKHFKILLSDKNSKSIFIPAGFAHGFLSLKKENIVYYYCTNYRSAKHEIGLLWNDKDLKIKWPSIKPKISEKDKKNLKFSEFKNLF